MITGIVQLTLILLWHVNLFVFQACKNKKKGKGNATNIIASRTSETEEMLIKWEIMAEQARLKRESEAGSLLITIV